VNAPQTEQEMEAYFFNLIGRKKGEPANDFSAVLNQEFPWNGQRMKIPHNKPGPGELLTTDAPFFGLTRQTDPSGNASKARIWIPAAVPDHNDGKDWYTRYIQIVEDAPGGVHGRDFVWSWSYKSGHAYVPLVTGSVQPPVVTPPPPTTPPNNDALEARVKELEQSNARLAADIATIQQILGQSGVDDLLKVLKPILEATVRQELSGYAVKGATKSRSVFGIGAHYHEVDLPLEKKGLG
jgi:hypothetical protein